MHFNYIHVLPNRISLLQIKSRLEHCCSVQYSLSMRAQLTVVQAGWKPLESTGSGQTKETDSRGNSMSVILVINGIALSNPARPNAIRIQNYAKRRWSMRII